MLAEKSQISCESLGDLELLLQALGVMGVTLILYNAQLDVHLFIISGATSSFNTKLCDEITNNCI